MKAVTKILALTDVFEEDSENERTFYGFSDSDSEIDVKDDKDSHLEDEDQPDLSPKKQRATSKPFSGPQKFQLRVALRSTPSTQQSTDEEEAEEEEKMTKKRVLKRAGKTTPAKRRKRVKFEDVETAVETAVDSAKDQGSDSAEDVPASFLDKRERTIKANRAMLAQLMSDLKTMPGGAGILKNQAGPEMKKEKNSRPPRSAAAAGETRRNPERASRRQTRSMGGFEGPLSPKKEEVEWSLEEELLEDITEEEIELVADIMTEKVYNRDTGTTCHQCRQKTVDTKTCCRSEDCRGIVGQFCGPCLKNRYGEDVKALRDPDWKCPPCRGICNCSLCRKREGRCPTGILFPLAQYHGFSDVHSYLSSLRSKLKNEDNDVEV
ncbi:hypothetical protein F7725_017265 [Dissostichus mawsoni]|uniref:Zinc-finger domain-containing protein n=1 Tax=Dissostichus mawsoni TaxID=36200 RepID=A0A7J5Z3Z1_DISMA|nr:hypothetical protein F7725_017265 [Dissostichus mawsoni]